MKQNIKKIFGAFFGAVVICVLFAGAPMISLATFSSSDNSAGQSGQNGVITFFINPDEIFAKIRNFLVITPRKGTTTGFSVDIAVNKQEINQKTESWFWQTKDYVTNYISIVNENILQKTRINPLAILMFFYNNLYNMFATTFGLIKSVLPQ